MNSITNPVDFYSLVLGSFNGSLTTDGFKSVMIPITAFSTINVSALIKTNTATLQIHTNSVKNFTTGKTLFFETTLTADTPFYRRFVVPNNFFSITLTPSGTSDVFLNTSLNSNNQFSAFTFLNSSIDIDNDVALFRVANNFNTDLVRNLHTDFEKVNIQGFEDTLPAPAATETIGLGAEYFLPINEVSLQTIGNAADDPTGTGARTIKYNSVLFTNASNSSNFDTGVGTGTLGLNMSAINRAIVQTTGTGLKNAGDISVASTSGQRLALVKAGKNVSHHAYYKVATNKQLVLKDINIAATAPQGLVKVIEINTSGMEFSLGEFEVNTSYQQLSYTIDGLVGAGNVVKVNFTNTSSVAAGQPCNINVNLNGILCPLINNF